MPHVLLLAGQNGWSERCRSVSCISPTTSRCSQSFLFLPSTCSDHFLKDTCHTFTGPLLLTNQVLFLSECIVPVIVTNLVSLQFWLIFEEGTPSVQDTRRTWCGGTVFVGPETNIDPIGKQGHSRRRKYMRRHQQTQVRPSTKVETCCRVLDGMMRSPGPPTRNDLTSR